MDGLRLRCLQAGEAGAPVVLLHGGGVDGAGFSFRSAIPRLAEQHQVYAPEWPGFGESDPLPSDWSIASLVPLVGKLLDAFELERATLVGLSMGGGAALGFALEAPRRVDRLALVDSYGLGGDVPGRWAGYVLVHASLLNWLSWTLVGRSRRLARMSLRATFPCHPEMATDEVFAEFWALLQRPGAAAAWRQLQRKDVLWGRVATNYVDRLPLLDVPTLLVHGARDPAVPLAWAERAQRLIPGSGLVVIPESGHITPLERPRAFNEALLRHLAGGQRDVS
ncbi:MAG TPA: alpha/beta fold hydrolase [Chloroflexota bacterium]